MKYILILIFLLSSFLINAEEVSVEYSAGTKTLFVSEDPIQLRQDFIDMARLYLNERELRKKAVAEAEKLLGRVDELVGITKELTDKLSLAKDTIIQLDKPQLIQLGYGFQFVHDQFVQEYSLSYTYRFKYFSVGTELMYPLGNKILFGFQY
jgi:hypothetical protein